MVRSFSTRPHYWERPAKPSRGLPGRSTVTMLSAGLVLAFAFALPAAEAAWKPGTAYYISEQDANDALEQGYDHAYCDGIPRFGKRGRFPYQEFLRFDCTLTHNARYCTGARYRSVRGKRQGFFRMVVVKKPRCY